MNISEQLDSLINEARQGLAEIVALEPKPGSTGVGRDSQSAVEIRLTTETVSVRVVSDWEAVLGAEGLTGALQEALFAAQRGLFNAEGIASEGDRTAVSVAATAPAIDPYALSADPRFREALIGEDGPKRISALFAQAKAIAAQPSRVIGANGIASATVDAGGVISGFVVDPRRARGQSARRIEQELMDAALAARAQQFVRGPAELNADWVMEQLTTPQGHAGEAGNQ